MIISDWQYTPGKGILKPEIKKKFGTIFTPSFVVEKTIDLAWKYLPKDKDKLSLTYIDPACGDGHFLIAIYKRLMLEKSDLSSVDKSHHILTKCIYGIEIIHQLSIICRHKMVRSHKEFGGDRLIDDLNIYWGNTIVIPEDTKEKWYKNRPSYEGGILPDIIRNNKWDCIITNPPYCHLRNFTNEI